MMRLRRSLIAISFATLVIAGARLLGASPPTAGPVVVEAPKGNAADVALPNKAGSLKFTVLGDFGTAEKPEYELAAQMAKFTEGFKVDFVVTVGDNLYGAERPQDFKSKFEDPYKPMLDAGVKFYASLGNHDARAQRYYKPFNMNGKLYFSLKAPEED